MADRGFACPGGHVEHLIASAYFGSRQQARYEQPGPSPNVPVVGVGANLLTGCGVESPIRTHKPWPAGLPRPREDRRRDVIGLVELVQMPGTGNGRNLGAVGD